MLARTESSKYVLSRRSRIGSGTRPRSSPRTRVLPLVSGNFTSAGRLRKNSHRSTSRPWASAHEAAQLLTDVVGFHREADPGEGTELQRWPIDRAPARAPHRRLVDASAVEPRGYVCPRPSPPIGRDACGDERVRQAPQHRGPRGPPGAAISQQPGDGPPPAVPHEVGRQMRGQYRRRTPRTPRSTPAVAEGAGTPGSAPRTGEARSWARVHR